jgi:hypothetical protein
MVQAATAEVLTSYAEDAEVKEVAVRARTIADEARALEVVDEASNGLALTMIAECRKATSRIDDLRRKFVDPLNAHVKNINSFFKDQVAPADEANRILTKKASDYRMKVAEAARKEQERLRLLAEKRQQAAAEKAEAKGLEAPPVMPIVPTVAAPAKTVQTDTGAKVTFVERWSFEVTDPDAVARNLCCPDEKKIGQMVRAKVWKPEDAPAGIRITVTQEPTVRG